MAIGYGTDSINIGLYVGAYEQRHVSKKTMGPTLNKNYPYPTLLKLHTSQTSYDGRAGI